MNSFLFNPKERERFIKFAVVGFIGAVVDFGAFNVLIKLLHIPVVIASIISFSAAVTSNFIWNRFWTYPDSRSKSLIRQLFQFGIINVIGLLIRTPLFAFLAERLPVKISLIKLAIAVVVVMFWNFFINRYWTYSDVKSTWSWREVYNNHMVTNAQTKLVAIYTTRGDLGGFLGYPYLYNCQGEYIGWVTEQRQVYSVHGHYVGTLTNDPRILRKQSSGYLRPRLNPPSRPKNILPPATVPLPSMMPEIPIGMFDVLEDAPEMLPAVDFGDLREDMD
jgi:putative flippase GtrA